MDESNFDKPFIDFPDLVKLLEKRGLSISNEQVANDLFKTYGYYPIINGFKKPFQSDPKNELYNNNASLEQVFSEFVLDSQFQEIFLTALFPIENHFKNIIGYFVSKFFGVNNHDTFDSDNPDPKIPNYLSLANYTNTKSVKKRTTIEFIKDKVLTSKDDPTAYYRKHKNHIPPWIMMRNMMLGTAIRYYQILPADLKTAIINEMIVPIENENIGQKKELFLSSIEILRKFRNAAAHSSPLYLLKVNQDNDPSIKVLKKYMGPSILTKSDKRVSGRGTRDLFAGLICLMLLARNEGQRSALLEKLVALENSYSENKDDFIYKTYKTYLKISGLPENYIERLQLANQKLIEHNYTTLKLSSKNGDTSVSLKFQVNPKYGIAQDRKVFITRAGNKYHMNKDCPALKGSNIQEISILSAKQRGLEKCNRE
ncbi:Abi family protein [Loigolactobacillus coryniformis]|uniref:Abi family protein n=1 Tax=Loigolactobacillus coryniformis TaxID=1610 RepID=UPI003F24A470